MLKKNIIRISVPFVAILIMTGCMNDTNQDEEQINEEEMNEEEMMENGENEANTQ